jgi:hypothetical protein
MSWEDHSPGCDIDYYSIYYRDSRTREEEVKNFSQTFAFI